MPKVDWHQELRNYSNPHRLESLSENTNIQKFVVISSGASQQVLNSKTARFWNHVRKFLIS